MKRIVRQFLLGTILCSLVLPSPYAAASELDEIAPSVSTIQPETDSSLSDAPATETVINQVEPLPENIQSQQMQIPTSAEPQIMAAEQATIVPQAIVSYSPMKTDGNLLVTAFQASVNSYLDFIELHNMTSEAVNLDLWQVRLLYANQETETECSVQLAGFLLPQADVTFARSDVYLDGQAEYLTQRFSVDNCQRMADQSLEMIEVYSLDVVSERIVITPGDPTSRRSVLGSWQRDRTPSGTYSTTYRSGLFSKDFIVRTRNIQTSPLHTSIAPAGLSITEVLISPRDCLVSDTSLDCHDYIKLTNTNEPDTSINLGNYILRSGFTSSTTKFSLTGEISGGQTKIINKTADGEWLSISANDGTVWFEDVYGLAEPYDMEVPAYVGSSSNKGKSWALDPLDQKWKWAVPSPYTSENNFTPDPVPLEENSLSSCAADQYRSPDTNRCRKIATETTLTPCKDGQYRSEETNRCRSLALAVASVLKPCADDQFRNPATNRCKSIASMDDVVQPCDEGKERNPATNRCRTVLASTVPTAAFAVEPIAETGTAFVGWWVLGGVGILALGYAGWEWRREVASGIRRVGSIFSSNK